MTLAEFVFLIVVYASGFLLGYVSGKRDGTTHYHVTLLSPDIADGLRVRMNNPKHCKPVVWIDGEQN